jgi:DNA mismatch repair ATPase MutS
MRFRAVKLFTSMRTTDSLSHSESYFYAELKRLKSLKDRLTDEEDIFFILDEILKGTNSADKSTGSRLFMKKLTELGASGLIATHDTSLGGMEKEHPGVISNKCFEIEINGDTISFDYLLRDGITTRMNAALLMKEMGITD